MIVRGVAFLVVIAGCIHVGENGLPVYGLVESLRGAWTLRMLGGIFLVDLGFLFGAFFLTLPVAAELVVKEFVRSEVGLTGVGVKLDDLLHRILIHLFAQVRLFFLCGRAAGRVGFLDLPEDVCRTPCGLSIERRARKHFDNTAVDEVRGAGSVYRTAGVRCERLLVGCRAHQDLVAVGSVFDDDAFGLHPSGNGWRGVVGIEDGGVAGVFFLNVGVGIDAQLSAVLFGDDHLASYLHASYFLRVEIGGDVQPGDAQGGSAGAGHGLLQVVFFLLGGQRQGTKD